MQREQTLSVLLDVAQQSRFDGRISGARWTTGRWEEKQALRFEQAADAVLIDFSGESFEQITLSSWVNVDQLVHPLTALVYSNKWERPGALHWTILEDGRIELAIYGNEPAVVQSDAAARPLRVGRWVHLAVVYDVREKYVRFYMNGVSRGTQPYTHALPADLQQAQVGNWNQHDRHLVGRVDELIVFRKALSDEEIRRIYISGAP
jgi:hypothetical protein